MIAGLPRSRIATSLLRAAPRPVSARAAVEDDGFPIATARLAGETTTDRGSAAARSSWIGV